MNYYFRYALIALGECILIAMLYLLFRNRNSDVMLLNMVMLSLVYFVNALGYPSLYKQTGENAMAGYGLAWMGTWLYSGAVLIGIILFNFLSLAVEWQIVLYSALSFFYLLAIYWAGIAAKHAGNLERKHETEVQGLEQLKAKAGMLQAVLGEEVDEDTRREVTEVIERIGYLIPNRSPMSSALEKQIDSLLDTLSDTIVARQPNARIRELAGQCKTTLKQRMSLRN